jgi:hypothetical protein
MVVAAQLVDRPHTQSPLCDLQGPYILNPDHIRRDILVCVRGFRITQRACRCHQKTPSRYWVHRRLGHLACILVGQTQSCAILDRRATHNLEPSWEMGCRQMKHTSLRVRAFKLAFIGILGVNRLKLAGPRLPWSVFDISLHTLVTSPASSSGDLCWPIAGESCTTCDVLPTFRAQVVLRSWSRTLLMPDLKLPTQISEAGEVKTRKI